MTRPKDIGTRAETGLAHYLSVTYWPFAERRPLQGRFDKGDTTGHPGLVFECKAATKTQYPSWLRETEVERVNAKADFGVLVHKPVGVGFKNVPRWSALMQEMDFLRLIGQAEAPAVLAGGQRINVYAKSVSSTYLNLRNEMRSYFGNQDRILDVETIYVKTNRTLPNYMAIYLSTMVDLLNKAGYGQR